MVWMLKDKQRLEEVHFHRLSENTLQLVVAARLLSKRLSSSILSKDEYDRLVRLRMSSDRERFLVAHGLKRLVLAQLLAVAPPQLQFKCLRQGKPFLPLSDIVFNLSHGGDWIVLALSKGGTVGVDVEQPRPMRDGLPTAAVFNDFDDIDYPPATNERFFAAWTLKEAVCKCAGLGLNMPLPLIRLHRKGRGRYQATYKNKSWWAHHDQLPDGAHLSIASSVSFENVHTSFII